MLQQSGSGWPQLRHFRRQVQILPYPHKFFSLIPLRIALLSSAHHSPALSLCPLRSFIYNCLCSASRLPWGILLPVHVMVPWCSFKVWSLEASWNAAKRAVAGWIKQTLFKFPKLWCLGQHPVCLSIIPLQGLLWRKRCWARHRLSRSGGTACISRSEDFFQWLEDYLELKAFQGLSTCIYQWKHF